MYPDAINLPFNSTVIREFYAPAVPGSPDPGGIGYWVIIQGGSLVVDTSGPRPVLPHGQLPDGYLSEAPPLYLGMWQGRPLRLLRVGKDVKILPPHGIEPFNAVEERLDDRLLTIGGVGNQLLHWQRQSAHCSRCGSSVAPIPATWGKKCAECGAEHYPHIHPCIIVLISRGDQFLLVRKPEWAPGRFGLVAGFLDFGESLEECVHREVKEETGLEVTDVRYIGSQSWPFPSQLMAGFVAEYAGGELLVDGNELEDARWFSRSDLPPAMPPRRSIARWIIDTFALHSAM